MYEQLADRPVVQKYGGTSVGSVEKIKALAQRIKRLHVSGIKKIAIVVSAMSGETNRLVALVEETNPEASRKNFDMAVAAGEQVSVALLASALEAEGLRSEGFLAFQLGIKTDDLHARARIQEIAATKIFAAWQDDIIPVIAGFQGVTSSGAITTLGRGGSDTSAVALAVALDAGFCEINTDVDGVYTADPRIVKEARLNPLMDFETALEMASLGSKVLHPRCVELGAKYSMPIVVRNSFKSDQSARTIIMNFNEKQKLEAPVVSGVTAVKDVARMTLQHLPRGGTVLADIFKLLAEKGINIDIIVQNLTEGSDAMRLGFTLERSQLTKARSAIEQWLKTSAHSGAQIESEEKLAKVSIVGLGMQSHPGVASRCFSLLSSEGIDIKMISTSEIKVSCVIEEGQVEKACQALHEGFLGTD